MARTWERRAFLQTSSAAMACLALPSVRSSMPMRSAGKPSLTRKSAVARSRPTSTGPHAVRTGLSRSGSTAVR